MTEVTEYFRGIEEMRDKIYYAGDYTSLEPDCFYQGNSIAWPDEVREHKWRTYDVVVNFLGFN